MKKQISLALIGAMTAATLAGCGGSSSSAPAATAAAGGATSGEKLSMGAADMIVCSPALMTGAGVKEIDMFSCEYLFDSFDHWMT